MHPTPKANKAPNDRALQQALAQAPQSPGVYFFMGSGGELLYVGKARDIRKRLMQHSQVKPADNGWISPRYELISDVRWEETGDESAASAREADLIVALRPPYNAHIRQGRWAYINLEEGPEGMRFQLSPEAAGKRGTYGCFPHLGKGVSLMPAIACSDGYTAFLRLLWAAGGGGRSSPITDNALGPRQLHRASRKSRR